MLFKVTWLDKDLWSHKGFVNAGNRYEAQNVAQNILTEQCLVSKVEWPEPGEVTPDTVIMND